MGWTEAQWREFCEVKGVNVRQALSSGEVHLDPKGEQRAKKRTKSPSKVGISYTERKQDPKLALEPPVARAQPRVEDSGRRPRVSIIIRGLRLRFLDPDNFVGSCKATLDGLVRAGIAPDDSGQAVANGDVHIAYEQQLVTAYTKECTEIEIVWNDPSPVR